MQPFGHVYLDATIWTRLLGESSTWISYNIAILQDPGDVPSFKDASPEVANDIPSNGEDSSPLQPQDQLQKSTLVKILEDLPEEDRRTIMFRNLRLS